MMIMMMMMMMMMMITLFYNGLPNSMVGESIYSGVAGSSFL
jgi:hypothetical protein